MAIDISALFREHNAGLLRFLERRGLDRHEASDLAQDAFLRVMAMSPAQPIANIRAYLYAITRNLATDALRRRRIGPFIVVPEEVTWEIADDAPSPEQVVMWRQELAILRAVFLELPPQQQRIFYLSRIEGCTFAEIGKRLSMSPNTVYGQLARILVQMRLRMLSDETDHA